MTTREEIIKLAREAGLVPTLSSMPFLEAFYQAAYAAGIEEAAKVCADLYGTQELDNLSYVEGWDDGLDLAESTIKGKAAKETK